MPPLFFLFFFGYWFYRTCDWIRRSHGCGGCMIRFSYLKSGDRLLLRQRPSGAEDRWKTQRLPGQIMANSGQKVVLITGCSSGIGLRIAVTLAKDEKKRYHGKCAFFYIVSLIGPISSKPTIVWFAWKPIPCLLSPAKLYYCTKPPLRTKFGWVSCAALSLNANKWLSVVSTEIANPCDIGSISFCQHWDSVSPLVQPLSSESAVCRVGLCEDAACQAEL